MTATELRAALRARWQRLAQREKNLVAGAALLVALALAWWVALAPALSTLRQADGQHRELDARLQRMLVLRSEALALQSQPRQSHDEALRLLEASVSSALGPGGRLAIAGDQVTITLTGIPPEALARWLTQARVNARALPAQARLTRNAAGLWGGTLVLNLPPR